MIRVMVVDDQASARMGLSMMVGRDPGLSVVATADDGGAALAELARRKDAGEPLPDVVVSDVRMPGTGGVTLAREVASRFPSVRTLLLTTYDRDDYALGGLAAGAAGFLLKDATARELCRAVRELAAGGAVLTPRVTREVVARAVPGAAEDPERVPPPGGALLAIAPRARDGVPRGRGALERGGRRAHGDGARERPEEREPRARQARAARPHPARRGVVEERDGVTGVARGVGRRRLAHKRTHQVPEDQLQGGGEVTFSSWGFLVSA